MKANELNSQNNSITKKLYDLYLEFYKNENNFQNFNTNLKYKGYLNTMSAKLHLQHIHYFFVPYLIY